MIQAVPLMLDGVLCRAHYVIGIHEMNGKIVFLHDVLGDVPKEQITRDTVFTDYVVADFFSADFEAHTQDHLVYPEKKTLFDSCCMCEPKADCLLLNTMYYDPSNGGANEYSRHRTIAKLIEIQDDSLREVGDSPEPIQKSYSDSKMFFFGDCSVYMVSPHVMECTQGGEVVWRLRLNA
ncbi:MAG: hypothetical protein LBQ91_03545, partial [Oscillospiraceae bacterium]|nr:hypothetical protein [Oscillospiraceae bacterium]